MKLIATADLHINILSKVLKTFEYTKATLNNFKELCIKEKADYALILGDLFDFKTTTSTEGLINISKSIDELAEICNVIILVGNHDRASKTDDSLSIPKLFHNKKNITVVDNYSSLSFDDYNLHFVSYFDDETLVNIIKDIKIDKKKKNILFSHFAMNGFTMNKYVDNGKIKETKNEESLLNKKLLSKFDKVFLGDFHGYQTDGHITYVSSPIQLKHGDEFSEHGFIVIDDNFEHKFIENVDTPNYITVKLSKETLKSITKLENSYINLFVPHNITKEKVILLRDKLLKSNYEVHVIQDDKKKNEIAMVSDWNMIVNSTPDDIITQFLIKNEKIIKKNNWDNKKMLDLILN